MENRIRGNENDYRSILNKIIKDPRYTMDTNISYFLQLRDTDSCLIRYIISDYSIYVNESSDVFGEQVQLGRSMSM